MQKRGGAVVSFPSAASMLPTPRDPRPIPGPAIAGPPSGASRTLSAPQRTLTERDADVVARIRLGDEAAFEALHAEHHDALWRFAYTQVGSAHVAEEIVQDVFLALWRRRAEWEVATTVGGWLYGAVRHHVLRHLRQQRAVIRFTERAPLSSTTDALDAHDALAAIEEQELDDAVARALAALPERRRIAMTLRWKHQLSGPEIAQTMGTTPEAVRVLLTRARQELAALLRL